MKLSKFLSIVAILLTLSMGDILANNLGYDSPPLDDLALKEADFYFLIDPDNDDVLLEKNADVKVVPSSMTKLMTAYVIFDQISKGFLRLDQQCIVSKDAYQKQGSTMFLNQGQKVTIDELLTGLLVVSGNDSAVVLAQETAGNIEDFVRLMNAKAKQIGLNHSHFKNPHGLAQDDHYMTMRDLAHLVARIYQDFPDYAHQYLGLAAYTYNDITQKNRNPLIQQQYEGIIGGKTGYTDAGGYGVVNIVKRGQRTLIAVMNQGKSANHRAQVITEMFDYGFNNFNKFSLFEAEQTVGKVHLWAGKSDELEVVIHDKIALNIPVPYELETINATIIYDDPVYSPIKKGQKIAKLVVTINNRKELTYDLFAKNDVKEAGFFKRIGQIVRHYLTNFKS